MALSLRSSGPTWLLHETFVTALALAGRYTGFWNPLVVTPGDRQATPPRPRRTCPGTEQTLNSRRLQQKRPKAVAKVVTNPTVPVSGNHAKGVCAQQLGSDA